MRSLILSVALLCAVSCASPRSSLPRIAELYSEAAKRHTRNPVVVIHGILGARLEQRSTGKTVWGAFTSDGIDPNTEAGVQALGLPLEIPASAHDYDPEAADVFAAGPLEALELGFLFTILSVEVYADIIRTLGAGGYTDRVVHDPFSPAYSEDHFTCFSFFYDWRRDNVENAIRFGAFLEEKRAEIARTAGNRIEKLRAEGGDEQRREADELEEWLAEGYRFDVVAHSMGGLIARYFLRFGANDLPADGSTPEITWAGAREIDRLIMVGTPNLGAADAVRNLIEGYAPSFILPSFHPTLIATMPSLYQLMPRTRHDLVVDEHGKPVDIDLFDVAVWDSNRWGLLDDDGERYRRWLTRGGDPATSRARAVSYLEWCLRRARQFHAALDATPSTPCRSRVYLFASDTEDTLTKTRLERAGDRFLASFVASDLYGPGDAIVPRLSAIADERFGTAQLMWLDSPVPWTNVTFIADDHIGLTSNPHFSNNTLFLLLMTRPPAL